MRRNHADLIEAFMEYMRFSDAPRSYQRWAFVSAIASILERKVWLTRDHDTGWYPNLYLFLIGPPGSGKSTVAETAMSFLYELECVDFLAEDINDASLLHDLAKIGTRKKFEWNGQSFPHSAATLFASEAAEAFTEQAKGLGIIKKLTSLYNGGPLGWHLTHGTGRSTRGDGNVKLLNPCVNLLACSTPEWLLKRCMTRTDAQGGFGSRILLVVSKEELRSQDEWETENKAKDMLLRSSIIEDMRKIALMRGPYTTSACFKDAWRECQRRYDAWKDERARAGILGGYQQRKMTQLYKVTMCLAAGRRDDLVLTGADILDAWQMLSDIEADMVDVLDQLELSPDARNRQDILAYLRKTEKVRVTKSELVRDFPRMDFQELNIAINGLIAMGRLVIVESQPSRTVYMHIVPS